MGNTRLLQRVIFTLLALSFISSLFAYDKETREKARQEAIEKERKLLRDITGANDIFEKAWEINPIANDEVVTAEEVYAVYCNPEEFNALAKKVRDGASFIPFREKELLEDGHKKHALANYVKNKIDFGGFALSENFTKEEIQQEIDRYKRNAKFHRANLVEYLESFFNETFWKGDYDYIERIINKVRKNSPYAIIRDTFYMSIKIKMSEDDYRYEDNTYGLCPRKDKY